MKKYMLTWGLIHYLVFSEDKEPLGLTDAQMRRALKKEERL